MEQLQLFSMPDEVLKLNDEEITRGYQSCYYTLTSSQGAEDLAWQQSNWGEYRQLSLWKSTPTLNSSSSITSPESQSTQTSLATTQSQENLTSLQWDFRVREQATQEAEQDFLIIECRKVKRGSKLYSQFWYHYEFWHQGDRVIKKSRYIPKRLVSKVERMNQEKAPVDQILKVLQNKSKRNK